jgi:acyl carrier protein
LENLEKTVLGLSVDEIWAETESFFAVREPEQLERAQADPRHRMALVFRWYLFNGAQWAREGVTGRRGDYQIWCGPAMGAFNQWVEGSHLAPLPARGIVTVHEALWTGAAQWMRRQALRAAGLSPRPGLLQGVPTPAPPPPAPAPPRPLPTPPTVAPTLDPRALADWLVTQIAQEIGRPEAEIDPSAPFASLDIDSKRALSLLAALEQKLGRRLSPTIIWNYPNIERLAARLSRG